MPAHTQRSAAGLALALLAVVPAHSFGLEGGPGEVAAQLERALERAASEREFGARRDLLAPVVRETHHAAAIARTLTPERFDALDEAQREELGAALLELATASLAARFDGPAGARFERIEERELGPDRALVASSFPGERDARRRVEWTLARAEGAWRIIDATEQGGGGFDELRAAVAANAIDDASALVGELRARAARFAERPGEVVARLQRALIDAMRRAGELGYPGRHDLLAPVVTDTHDFESLAKLVASDAWRKLNADERRALVETFRELGIATYAARFDSYAGQSFGPPEERDAPKGAVLVKSRFRKADGGEAQFDYLMRRVDGRWRILNIVVDGVSDLALKRTEYGDWIESKGFPALLAKMREQIARCAAGEEG